ncbi:cytochrome P450 [Streptomyces sp. NBC_01589]|uniref:cytochrome P450 n=1 Tax=Streptomyces sp. NBC_01589 TaxID=2975886 RepID=UPI00386D2D6D
MVRHRNRRRYTSREPCGCLPPRTARGPLRFRVERNPIDHLPFGYGPHGCAGEGLARLEAHAVIEALCRRTQRLVVGPKVRVPRGITRSIEEFPVLEARVEPAGRVEHDGRSASPVRHRGTDGRMGADVGPVDGACGDAEGGGEGVERRAETGRGVRRDLCFDLPACGIPDGDHQFS